MHITAYCPGCRTRYQVDPGLNGLKMRCPNPACRTVFVVEDRDSVKSGTSKSATDSSRGKRAGENEAALAREKQKNEVLPVLEAEVLDETPESPRAVPPPKSSGHVQDSVPLLEAEVLEEEPPVVEQPSWSRPPPVRRADVAGHDDPLADAPADSPQLPAWQSPPPVRRPGGESQSVEVFESDVSTRTEDRPLALPTRASAGRRALWMIGLMVLVGGVLIGSITVVALNKLFKRENGAFAKAQSDYQDGRFAIAAAEFQALTKDYPKSKELPRYQSFAALSLLRDQVSTLQSEPRETLGEVEKFLGMFKGDPTLNERRGDVREVLRKLAEDFARNAKSKHDDVSLELAVKSLKLSNAEDLRTVERPNDDDKAIRDQIAEAETEIAAWKKKQLLVQELQKLRDANPTADSVRIARARAAQQGLAQDADVKVVIAEMQDIVRKIVRYVPEQSLAMSSATKEQIEPSLLVTPLLSTPVGTPREGKRVILALVRGVLYGLNQGTGEVQWARRVGIDMATLPVRLPATSSSPELFLVISAERNTLMAIVAESGEVHWRHQLNAPCLGRPLVVGLRAFVPTYDGRVNEIEIVKGSKLGHFDLGQPLTVGGVWQPGTDLLYFPGDSENIFVLDAALSQAAIQAGRQKQCLTVLHTGHPSGSLRSEPVIIERSDPFAAAPAGPSPWPSYLIVNQADGLDHMKLRVYALPIESPDAQPVLLPEPRTRGWCWFQPYFDPEKLAYVTDAGVMGLYGINQVRNEDKPIFSQFREEQKIADSTQRLGRAQVIHATENDFWILANGNLQRLQFSVFGQSVLPSPHWPGPIRVGSPVHASQLDETGKTLFVVTHDTVRQIHLATAVGAENGAIYWQRQLGMDPVGEPLVMDKNIVLMDRGGGLSRFESSKYANQKLRPWRVADAGLSSHLGSESGGSYLLSSADGKTIYEIFVTGQGKHLTIRTCRPSAEGSKPQIEDQAVEIRAPLAGVPALAAESLLLPLADGVIYRVPLPLNGQPITGGPDWRAGRTDDDPVGYIIYLGGDEFVTTDGGRGLAHYRWPAGQGFALVPPNRPSPTAEMPFRIVSAPILLPRAMPTAEPKLFVATSDGVITLLTGAELGTERFWKLEGKAITAGPFLRGERIGCIVDRRRLVWIDPAKEKILWQYTMPGEGIVGQPRLIGDSIIMADVSGRFVALNPENGEEKGTGYTLSASAAPVASPIAFGTEEALIPLTDGTIFLLNLKQLLPQAKEAASKMP